MSVVTLNETPEATAGAEGITVRPFRQDDYPRVVAIENANFREYPGTVEEWSTRDRNRDPKCLWRRFVAESRDGETVGFGVYEQSPYMYHPRKFWVGVSVDPEWQGQGIGSRLFDHVLSELAPYDPLTARAMAREDYERSVRFLAKRDFAEEMREWESRLDVTAFDFSPFEGARERVAAQGIAVRTLRELESDPDRDRKLWQVDAAISVDMPSPDAPTTPDFETWRKNTYDNPGLLPDGYFVAVDTTDGNRFVGVSQLWKPQAGDDLDTGATGVLREYRRRGIALALKLHAVAYAREAGVAVVKTWNAQSNRAMLSINEALGFAKQPAWISYARHLKEEGEAAR